MADTAPPVQGPAADNSLGDDDTAAAYEHTHVHAVYDAIADHFSATRHSPWPLVARFLAAQPPGSIGLDVGCGNGKYLLGGVGENAGDAGDAGDAGVVGDAGRFLIGCDRSPALAATAYARAAGRGRPRADVFVSDALALPFRAGCADFAVCVAVVHHLATRARRQAAIAELLSCVRPAVGGPETGRADETSGPDDTIRPGRVLLYVWALEQAASRRGWAAGGEQDLLVPWVKTTPKAKTKTKTAKKQRETKTSGAGGAEKEPCSSGDSRTAVADAQADTHADAHASAVAGGDASAAPATFHRYYHLYREGELEEDVAAAGGRVVAHGYEKDNWWVIADPV